MTPLFACRLCKSAELEPLFSLGELAYTGIFPKSPEQEVPVGKLALVKCAKCHLVQLSGTPNMAEMYGENYGYRSGLNSAMALHLMEIAKQARATVVLRPGDIVLDIE